MEQLTTTYIRISRKQSGSFFQLLVLLFFPVVLSAQSAMTTYTYNVKLDEQYRTKEIVSLVLDDAGLTHRHLTETGFKFSSAVPLSGAQLLQMFTEKNIPFIAINEIKESIPFLLIDKAGGNNCEAAELLCSNTSQSANSAGPGNQELTGGNSGCLGVEHQSSWYYLNVQTGGSLSFVVDPASGSDDYDFAVWGPFTSATAGANCPPTSGPMRCSYSDDTDQTGLRTTNFAPCNFGFIDCDPVSEGINGNSWCQNLTVAANEVYILLVDNFSNSGNPYDLSFSGTAVLGCTPVVLPVELTAFTGTRTSAGNLIKWTTETEHNSAYFSVEWTVDPVSGIWKTIDEISAAGNSSSETRYGIAHASPDLRKTNYYRLVQTDTDGTVHIYTDRIIAMDNSGKFVQPVRIVNLLGQEVSAETSGMVIYQFEDGTSMKVFH